MRANSLSSHDRAYCNAFITAMLIACATGWCQQIDASDPKAALKNLYLAVERGDAQAIPRLLFVADDPQQQLLKGYTDLIIAGKRLGDVAKQKFPGAGNALAQGTISPEDAAKIDAGKLSVEGDKATIQLAGRAEPVNLRKIDGGWRMVVGEASGSTPAQQAERLAMLHAFSDAMRQSADEINADKYATIQEAEGAVKQRLSAVLSKTLQNNPPASRPATRPN